MNKIELDDFEKILTIEQNDTIAVVYVKNFKQLQKDKYNDLYAKILISK